MLTNYLIWNSRFLIYIEDLWCVYIIKLYHTGLTRKSQNFHCTKCMWMWTKLDLTIHTHTYIIFCMEETWAHVFMHWQKCKCRLWTNCFTSRRPTANLGPLNLRDTYSPISAVSSMLTTRPWPIRQNTDWYELNGPKHCTHNAPIRAETVTTELIGCLQPELTYICYSRRMLQSINGLMLCFDTYCIRNALHAILEIRCVLSFMILMKLLCIKFAYTYRIWIYRVQWSIPLCVRGIICFI